MTLNDKPHKLKIGDKITSEFYKNKKTVIRTITFIEKDSGTGSGYRASADGGEECKCCKHIPSKNIERVDAAWFIPIK